MRGIRRVKGAAQYQVRPLLREDLFTLLDSLGDDARAIRDQALLLVGWARGFRSSELVGLYLADIGGLVLQLCRSNTDQTGQGRKIDIPLGRTLRCPVSVLSARLGVLAPDDDSIFRPVDCHGNVLPNRLGSEAVSTILRNRLANARIDPEGYSAHNLRAGLAASATKARLPTNKKWAQAGHSSS